VQVIAGIPDIILLGREFASGYDKLGLAACVAAGTLLVSWGILHTRLGLIAESVRYEPLAAEAIGIPVRRIRVGFFVLAAIDTWDAIRRTAGIEGKQRRDPRRTRVSDRPKPTRQCLKSRVIGREIDDSPTPTRRGGSRSRLARDSKIVSLGMAPIGDR
jgi:hypothetical protein